MPLRDYTILRHAFTGLDAHAVAHANLRHGYELTPVIRHKGGKFGCKVDQLLDRRAGF